MNNKHRKKTKKEVIKTTKNYIENLFPNLIL